MPVTPLLKNGLIVLERKEKISYVENVYLKFNPSANQRNRLVMLALHLDQVLYQIHLGCLVF